MTQKRILVVLAGILSLIILILAYETRVDILEWRYSNKDYRAETGTWGYFLDDIYSTIKESIPISNAQARKIVESFKNGRQVLPYFDDHKDALNIVLLQLEGVDAITLDLEIEGVYVMPHLHQLKEQGLYMNHAYDQTGSGRTSDGEFLAVTSLLPVENESMYLNCSLKDVESLPKILRRAGYNAFSIHGYESGFYNRRIAHSELGYEKSWFEEELEEESEEDDYLGWGLSDEYILGYAASLLEQDEKTFLHVITLSNHHPFDAVSNKYEDVLIKEPENIVEYYLNSVNYVDNVIGDFVQTLDEMGILDKTLLVIFSDHDSGITQELYEYFGLEYDIDDMECDKIPLLFYGNGLCGSEDMPSGQADIMPMILSYLGIDIPDTCMGLNYIDGDKIVYLQDKDIVETGQKARSHFEMAEVTKSIIRYKDS